MDSTYRPRHQRIITHATTKMILHIEDALDIGKLHIDLWAFQRGQGHSGHAEAYIDADEARLLVEDLAAGQLPEPFQAVGGRANGEILARVLTIEEAGEKARLPLRLRIENGPGVQKEGGLIQPAWWGKGRADVSLALLLDWRTARKLALAVREHMTAWAAATILQRRAEDTWQPEPAEPTAQEEPPESVPAFRNGQRTITAFQRAKIEESYGRLFPDRDPILGVDAWFRQRKGHPISEATYEEGRDALSALLERHATRGLSTPRREKGASR